MGYLSWHDKPGYWGDVVRHFHPETRLLDVGCGGAWLGEHFERYTGVDVSAEAVAAGSGRGLDVRKIEPAQPLPFPDQSFDGVVLKDVLEHVGDPVALVDDVHRVLRRGGKVFASSPDAQRWVWDDYTHRRPFTRKSFRLLFADRGFDVERVAYESVMPGTSILSRRTKRKRRPRALGLLAWLPLVRRNVWIVARRKAQP